MRISDWSSDVCSSDLVVTMDEAVKRSDIFVTATGNADVITAEHMAAMKNMAIVCNIGHFDSEIQIAALANYKWTEVKQQGDRVEFPEGKQIIILSKGRLVNLGNATGPPSLVMNLEGLPVGKEWISTCRSRG